MNKARKAFLLSAGLGTRLRPLTNEIPKCLLPIDGRPLLEIWLEHIAEHDIEEVLVNTHWRREQVDHFLNCYRRKGLKVLPFNEPTLLGSAGTLLANRNWIADGEPFFILYGDNLTDVDLGGMLEAHRRHGLPFTLGVFRAADPTRCGIAEVGPDGLVTSFVEKPEHPKSDKAAAGIYIADNRIFEFFPKENSITGPLDLGFHVIPRLVGRMKAYSIDEFLMDIGTLEAYGEARRLWAARTGR